MIPWLEPHSPFPDTGLAQGPDSDAPGLLAAGADLSSARLAMAYQRGIFPWFREGQPILWWSTAPRMVLETRHFRLSRSLRKAIARLRAHPDHEVRIDTRFDEVMAACASVPRDGQRGTWIVPAMQQAYRRWHQEGHVHSFETWLDGELVGGLYGVCLGRMFYGESMFAKHTDASKIALAALVCFCRAHGIEAIDCQQQTAHLASLGAQPWSRTRFEDHLKRVTPLPPPIEWAYDDSLWAHLAPAPPASAA